MKPSIQSHLLTSLGRRHCHQPQVKRRSRLYALPSGASDAHPHIPTAPHNMTQPTLLLRARPGVTWAPGVPGFQSAPYPSWQPNEGARITFRPCNAAPPPCDAALQFRLHSSSLSFNCLSKETVRSSRNELLHSCYDFRVCLPEFRHIAGPHSPKFLLAGASRMGCPTSALRQPRRQTGRDLRHAFK